MSKFAKALDRLRSQPADFTWDELTALLTSMGFALKKAGGSGRKFIHVESKATLFMHQPHPSRVLKAYQVREVIAFLTQENLIK